MNRLATILAVLSLVVLMVIQGCTPATPTPKPTSTPTPIPTATPTPSPVTRSDAVTVSAGGTTWVGLSTSASNRVEGNFTVEGGSGNDVNFSITDPFGNTILQASRVSKTRSFAFTAAAAGQYKLVFDNSFSTFSNKLVKYSATINWR